MPDFNVRSDSVNVEQIMEQIRARIREKRGVDYTEQQIRELAAVKLEKFLDPRGVRSDLLDQFRKAQPAYEPVARRTREVPQLIDQAQDVADALGGLFPELRQRDLPGTSLEQNAAQRVLQILDLHRYGRGGESQLFRRAHETQVARD